MELVRGPCPTGRPSREPPQVTLVPSETISFIPNPESDPEAFGSLDRLAEHIRGHGYYGGVRILMVRQYMHAVYACMVHSTVRTHACGTVLCVRMHVAHHCVYACMRHIAVCMKVQTGAGRDVAEFWWRLRVCSCCPALWNNCHAALPRPCQAVCKRFSEYCADMGIELEQRNFTLSYCTDIPRQCGLRCGPMWSGLQSAPARDSTTRGWLLGLAPWLGPWLHASTRCAAAPWPAPWQGSSALRAAHCVNPTACPER